MIEAIAVNNFRGIASGEIPFDTQLTLLVGPNGTGKSSVLDAILLAAHENTYTGATAAAERRSVDGRDPRWLIRGGHGRAQLTLRTDNVIQRLQVDLAANGLIKPIVDTQPTGDGGVSREGVPHGFAYADARSLPPVRLVEPYITDKRSLADLYTSAAEQGRRAEVNALLRDLLPNLQEVEIMSQAGKAAIYLTYPDGSRPAALAGDGVHLLLKLSLELASAAGGVALLEEPETHLHPAAIGLAARAIWATIRRGIQIVVTTHSIDLIDAIVASGGGEIEKLSLCRLRLTDGQLACSCLSGPDVAFSRSEIQDDLR